MKNKQGFSAIALIIILAILAIGGYWVWQSQLGSPPDGEAGPTSKSMPVSVTDTNPPDRRAGIEPPAPSTPSVDTANWKTYRDEQYGYQINYPVANVLTSLKITPEINVEDNAKTAACKSNQSISNVQVVTINNVIFYLIPLEANGGEFISVYTTIKNSLCYQILFRIGNRNYTTDSPQTKSAVELVNQIMSTFRFTK